MNRQAIFVSAGVAASGFIASCASRDLDASLRTWHVQVRGPRWLHPQRDTRFPANIMEQTEYPHPTACRRDRAPGCLPTGTRSARARRSDAHSLAQALHDNAARVYNFDSW